MFRNEFRNTRFSYVLGPEGVEQFVAMPELRNDAAIDADPLPPGQVWGAGAGAEEAGIGLYRIEAAAGPGGEVEILNRPAPPTFRESVRIGERNFYADARRPVGGRGPRTTGFAVRLRPMDGARSGEGLGMPVLAALCGAMLGRHARGGAVVPGALNLGGSVAPRRGAYRRSRRRQGRPGPAAARIRAPPPRRPARQFWTGLDIEFYADGPDSVFKALAK